MLFLRHHIHLYTDKKRLFRDFRVKWDKGFGAGGRRGIFLLQKAVTFSFAGFLEKEDAVVGVGMMV
jgi:hypothetical protein